ncbi:hypothetical protein Tco_1332196, partial [Tanacetum coccineum]
DDDSNDDDSDEVTKDDDDDDDANSDNDDEEKEYVRTPDRFEFIDDDEEYEELYKDVNVRLKDTRHDKEEKRDVEITDAGRDDVSDYATPVIQSSITKLLENIVLAKSSSKPKLTYEVAASLTEFELKNILLDKIQKSKPYQVAQEHKDIYDALKTSKDAEPSRGSKSKESKSSSSKGSKSQPKSSGKSAQAEEPVFEAADTEMPMNQGDYLGKTDDQPNVEEASRDDWFKKPERPLNPDSDWYTTKMIDFRPPQTCSSKIAKVEKPPITFDELMSTPIKFLVYVMHNLKIKNLTQNTLLDQLSIYLKGHAEAEWNSNIISKNVIRHIRHGSIAIESSEVTHVKVMKWYDYGYLEEIEVQREDQQLYKFRELDFSRLNLHDIEDMLLLLV